MKKPALLTKSLSGLASLALILASTPTLQIYAEELPAEEAVLESEMEESIPSIYTVTEFLDFQKNAEGSFVNEETQTKYGSLTAEPGTSLDQLPLPAKLVLNGYWEADGSDVLTTLELTDFDWKLKSDIGEIYSESTPEGSYVFVPDLDSYAESSDSIDAIKLAEGVKLLEIPVTIALPEAETTETAPPETEYAEPLPVETEYTEPAPAETEYIEPAPSETEYIEPAPAETEYTEPAPSETEYTEPAPSETDNGDILIVDDNGEDVAPEEDIFSGLDDSILGGDFTEDTVLYDESGNPIEDLSETEMIAVTESEPAETEAAAPMETEAAEPETAAPAGTEAAEPQTSAPAETEATETEAPAPADPVYEAPITASLALKDAIGNNLYTYNDAVTGQNLLTLTDGMTINVPALPCNSDIGKIAIEFVSDGKTFTLSYSDGTENAAGLWDFTAGSLTLKLKVADTANTVVAEYSIIMNVTKNAHTWSAATCTEDQKCSVCGTTNPGTALGHTWTDPTCTEDQKCSVCGTTNPGTALGHDWEAATCTTPKTCNRCGATEGKALGHDLQDDWEVTRTSTDTVHGEQIRFCHRDNCDYSETRALNIIGNPNNNTIANLAEGGQYNLNTKITFTAVGAAMGNTSPINGDVRYVPLSWNIQNTPGNFMDNFTGAFSISKAGSYTVTVTFQKQLYQDGWKATDIVDTKSVTFNVGNLVQGTLVEGTADGIKINPQTGDSTPIIPLAVAAVVALAAIIGVVIYKKKKA